MVSVRSSSSSWRYLPKLSTGSPLSRRRGSPRVTMGRTVMAASIGGAAATPPCDAQSRLSGSTSTLHGAPGSPPSTADAGRCRAGRRGSASGRRGGRHTPAPARARRRLAPDRRGRASRRLGGHRRAAAASAAARSSSATVSLMSRPKGGEPNRRRALQLGGVERPRVAVGHGADGRVVRQVGLDDRAPGPVARGRPGRSPGRAAGRSARRRARRAG